MRRLRASRTQAERIEEHGRPRRLPPKHNKLLRRCAAVGGDCASCSDSRAESRTSTSAQENMCNQIPQPTSTQQSFGEQSYANYCHLVDRRRWEKWVDRLCKPFGYIGVALIAVAVMRGMRVQALGSHRHPASETTGLLAAVGVISVFIFIILWALVWWEGRRRPVPPTGGHAADRRVTSVVGVDAISTTLLVTATLRFLSRVNELVEVGDGYYRHSVETVEFPRFHGQGLIRRLALEARAGG